MHCPVRPKAMTHTLPYPDLAGRRVLVTGAGLAAGGDVARGFAAHGCRMIVDVGASAHAHAGLTEDMRRHAQGLRVLSSDFSDADGIDRFADAALRAWDGIDIVVNVADAALAAGTTRLAADTLEDALAAMLRVPSRLTRVAAQCMAAVRRDGVIINVFAGRNEDLALHALAKSALEAMTQVEARQWHQARVRVYGLIAGPVELGLMTTTRRRPVRDATVPSEDVLDSANAAALFLASARGRWLNGSVLTVSA